MLLLALGVFCLLRFLLLPISLHILVKLLGSYLSVFHEIAVHLSVKLLGSLWLGLLLLLRLLSLLPLLLLPLLTFLTLLLLSLLLLGFVCLVALLRGLPLWRLCFRLRTLLRGS